MNGLLELVADAYQRNIGNPARQLVGNGVRGLLGLDPADYADSFGMEAYRNAQALSNAPTPLAFAALPAAMVKGAKAAKAVKAAPRDEALETARKNAVKMLGLPENNTAMDRAKALGFVDAYHGTAHDIKNVDPGMFGTSTGAQSAKQAFWMVDDPKTARGYAEYAANQAPVKRLLDQADKAEKRGQWDKYDELLAKAEQIESSVSQNPLNGQNIMPLMVRANRGVRGAEMDAKGAEFVDLEGGVNRLLRQAAQDKRDLAIIRNLSDDVGLNGRPATHYAAINPSVVRSRFAAFDPARVNENDLLGRADPALLALIAAGTALPVGYGLLTSNKDAKK